MRKDDDKNIDQCVGRERKKVQRKREEKWWVGGIARTNPQVLSVH